MSRKTSAHARKKRASRQNADEQRIRHIGAWACVIVNSKACEDDACNQQLATKLLAGLRLSYQKLCDRLLPASDTEAHTSLADAVSVAQYRVLEIGGPEANGYMHALNLAAHALDRTRERWERTGAWGLDGPARLELLDAIEIHEAIVLKSTPNQLQAAWEHRKKRVRQMREANKPTSSKEPK